MARKKTELQRGIEVEAEHADLVEQLNQELRFAYPPVRVDPQTVYYYIARAHLKEDPRYYTKLQRAGL